jgi:oligoribonuclease NrnB/cAMP/cGMP phosphodiesterase (DHH superfamily)
MKTLFERTPSDVIWIDHHKSTADYDYGRTLTGLRNFADNGPAGCELAWSFFFPDQPVPPGVTLIGDLDAWRLERVPDCFRFHEGLRLHDTTAAAPVWASVLSGDAAFLASTLARGELCCAYRDAYCHDLCDQLGFETTFAGHKAFVCNLSRFGSQAFGDRLDRYPICITFAHDGTQFSITLYTRQPHIDVSTICRVYGGGGHREAAGFTCQTLPFVR